MEIINQMNSLNKKILIIVIGFFPLISKAQTYKDSLEVFQLTAFHHLYSYIYEIDSFEIHFPWDYDYFNADSLKKWIKEEELKKPRTFSIEIESVLFSVGIRKRITKKYIEEKYFSQFPNNQMKWFVVDSSNNWKWFREKGIDHFNIKLNVLDSYYLEEDSAHVAWNIVDFDDIEVANIMGKKPEEWWAENGPYDYYCYKEKGKWVIYFERLGENVKAWLEDGYPVIEKIGEKQ